VAAAMVLVVTSSVALLSPRTVHAASSVQALLAQAEHNTNSVGTLVHKDQTTITSPVAILTATTTGSEDEIRNREHDFESVTLTGRGKNASKIQHYTLDVIFINGMTYYRTSLLQNNKWQSRRGSSLEDPYTGIFKRARTTVTFPKSYVFKLVGTSAGQTQLRAAFTNSKTNVTGTIDLWISGGSKPYIAREVQDYHSIKGAKGTGHVDSRFGPYDGPLVILAPTTQGST
jgi:hypothetical protein